MDESEREAILSKLTRAVYGSGPALSTSVQVLSRDTAAGWGGSATATNLVLETITPLGRHRALLTVVLPAGNLAAPVFVGLNFRGNHTISTDTAIAVPGETMAPLHYDPRDPAFLERGAMASRWPVPKLLERGFGLATVCYLQLGPDSTRLRDTGLFPLLHPQNPTGWGGLGMWAWYLQRILDVLREDHLGSRHIAFGHSRLGKTALWAAAQDHRFAGVISNDSGCMGASLSQSPGAETPGLLARVRPYWFCGEFADRCVAPRGLPTQDRLLAAIAPMPIYVASAEEDTGADPAGEQAAVGLVRTEDPHAPVGYHCRPGGHDVTATDWEHFMDFFDGPEQGGHP